jgi:hypothetical protein
MFCLTGEISPKSKLQNSKEKCFGGFQSPKVKKKLKKLPDSYSWFSFCSQKRKKERS